MRLLHVVICVLFLMIVDGVGDDARGQNLAQTSATAQTTE